MTYFLAFAKPDGSEDSFLLEDVAPRLQSVSGFKSRKNDEYGQSTFRFEFDQDCVAEIAYVKGALLIAPYTDKAIPELAKIAQGMGWRLVGEEGERYHPDGSETHKLIPSWKKFVIRVRNYAYKYSLTAFILFLFWVAAVFLGRS